MMANASAWASTSGTCGENATWTLDDNGTLTISGSGNISKGWSNYEPSIKNVVIGNEILGIGSYAFSYCSALSSVTIPSSVTSIGERAFLDCTALSSVTIPNSVISIGYCAFFGCKGLTSVTIPNSVTSIGNEAFYDCSGLMSINVEDGNPNYASQDGILYNKDKTELIFCPQKKAGSVVIPNSVANIASSTFANRDEITNVVIGNSVLSIGSQAFYSCEALASVTISSSVTGIGSYAFNNCYNLKEVINNSSMNITKGATDNGYVAYYADFVYNGGKTVIGDFVFSDQEKTLVKYTGNGGDVTLPENFKGENYTIWANAFSGCTGLTSVTIPNSVTSIGEQAFYGCTGLTSVTIPNSVASIGEQAFYGCTGLKEVINKSSMNITKGATDNGYVAYYANFVYNGGKTVIGDFVFSDQEKALVKYTGNGGDVTLPENFKRENYTIWANAFSGCTGLTSVTIPNSVTSIGEQAFYGCTGLTSVTIPNSVASIGEHTFSGCSGLMSINVESGNPNYASRDGILYNNDKTELIFCPQKIAGSVVIPNSVKSIGSRAFYNCSGLTNVVIPNSVLEIESLAFRSCSGLVELNIPNSVNTIGSGAFRACSNLAKVTIGNTVANIGSEAFRECVGLTDITVPRSVTAVDASAFYKCTGLKSITIEGSFSNMLGIFDGLSSLTDINISSENSDYTSVDGVLYNKDKTNLVYCPRGRSCVNSIPSSVTDILSNAFYKCTVLSSVTIPTFINKIEDNAFSGCSNLKEVINLSSLDIIKGKTTNGRVAYYADYVFNVGDNIVGDFLFSEEYLLVRYIGNGGDVTLPENFKGENYAIRENAFSGCANITSLTIPSSVTNIGNNAFVGCSGLRKITCEGEEPPTTSVGAFGAQGDLETVKIYAKAMLVVPSKNFKLYRLIEPWCKFDTKASDIAMDVISATDNATFTWTPVKGAEEYELSVYADEAQMDLVCVLNFDAYGRLKGLLLRNAGEEENYIDGFKFTVGSLNADKNYFYKMEVKDSADNVLQCMNGAFRTDNSTSVEEVIANKKNTEKYIKNGVVYIKKGDNVFRVNGSRVR